MKRKRILERIISVCLVIAFSIVKWKFKMGWLKSIAIIVAVSFLIFLLFDRFLGDDNAQD